MSANYRHLSLLFAAWGEIGHQKRFTIPWGATVLRQLRSLANLQPHHPIMRIRVKGDLRRFIDHALTLRSLCLRIRISLILHVIIEQFDLRLSCIVVESEDSPLKPGETNCVAVSIDHHVFGLHVTIDSVLASIDVCWLACASFWYLSYRFYFLVISCSPQGATNHLIPYCPSLHRTANLGSGQ